MHKVEFNDTNCRSALLHQILYEAYAEGEFKLSSGRISKYYVNCKPVSLSGKGLINISRLMLDKVEFNSKAVAGLTLGADPLVCGVSLIATLEGRDLDALIVRKEAKSHGTEKWLEGPLPKNGSLITLLEDVVTTGKSSLLAVKELRRAGYIVNRVVAIIDREEGGELALSEEQLELVSLFKLSEISTKSVNIAKHEK